MTLSLLSFLKTLGVITVAMRCLRKASGAWEVYGLSRANSVVVSANS